MNEIINTFDNLEKEIKLRDDRIQSLAELSDDVKEYIRLLTENIILNKQKRKLAAKYYETKMRKCEHVFTQTTNVVYSSKINEFGEPATDYDKYHLIFNHYCLKCGCTTDSSIIFDINRTIDPLFKEEPTNKVRPLIQTDIIENAEHFSIIECPALTTKEVARIWLHIKNNNPDLLFDQLLELFKLAINKEITKDNHNGKVRTKTLPISVYSHIK